MLLRIPENRAAIIDYLKGNTAIRTKNWRYIQYDERRKGEELYDLLSDPNEWTNLIGKHREEVETLRAWLPSSYAKEVPTKKAYDFDLLNYSWRKRE